MSSDKVTEVKEKMLQALMLIMEAAELRIPLIKQGKKEEMKVLWEDFIREFIRYTKNKSKETGIDLISMISLVRILK